ncbi:MAG: START-like domain-containing protein [Bacteroidales bacterium]|nr:START-like domain-containing protein [Bacteroidales bacterium]
MRKKIELEFVMRTSPKVLFPRLSTPAGLTEWFADNVTVRSKNIYDFHWNKTIQSAEQSYLRENVVVRYDWLDASEKDTGFFEFRIRIDELTGDVSLIVTDFAEEDEVEETIELWNTQINHLKHILGL